MREIVEIDYEKLFKECLTLRDECGFTGSLPEFIRHLIGQVEMFAGIAEDVHRRYAKDILAEHTATLPAEGCDSAAAAHSSSETNHV